VDRSGRFRIVPRVLVSIVLMAQAQPPAPPSPAVPATPSEQHSHENGAAECRAPAFDADLWQRPRCGDRRRQTNGRRLSRPHRPDRRRRSRPAAGLARRERASQHPRDQRARTVAAPHRQFAGGKRPRGGAGAAPVQSLGAAGDRPPRRRPRRPVHRRPGIRDQRHGQPVRQFDFRLAGELRGRPAERRAGLSAGGARRSDRLRPTPGPASGSRCSPATRRGPGWAIRSAATGTG
jgi:hypothetical protein